jgi:hypothetical protein
MREMRLVLRAAIAGTVLLVLLVLGAAPAAAQVAAKPQGEWFLGATGGAAAVQNVGAALGGEIGGRVTSKIELFGEGLALTDTATRRRIQTAQSVAQILQTTQGQAATATLKAPAGVFVGGLRLTIHEGGSLRIFVEGQGGVARVTFNPTFTLNGADITSQLSQFGVTLGADLAGTTTKATFGGGIGFEVRHNVWYINAKVGMISVKTPSQPSNIVRATATIGRWF